MYKLLLCWRYLRTRYIALASVISVTLGVATMIVVNSVMEGFTHEMQDRIHGILSDVVVESLSLAGVADAEWHMDQIQKAAGPYIEAMTPTVHVPAMLSFQYRGQYVTRAVQLIGIDENTKDLTGDFGKYLQHPAKRQKFNFDLADSGYDTVDHQADPTLKSSQRPQLEAAGWRWRRHRVAMERAWQKDVQPLPPVDKESIGPAAPAPPVPGPAVNDPFASRAAQERAAPENVFDPGTQQHSGLVLGIALVSYRDDDGQDRFLALPGDDVKLTFPTAGTPPRAIDDSFTVVDFYESKMSEYDQSFVFVPMRKLQELRGMIDPSTGVGYFTSIQIKLKDDRDGALVRDKLKTLFSPEVYTVQTWRDKQGALLAAVQMETAILNVLLFMIIAVAGFGILAIFFMIVVEKTRDIGILKSLGASRSGVLGIFLGYGLSLGMVGSGVGMVLGLLFVTYINEIADGLGWLTGHEVFDPKIYYFNEIPTIVEPLTVSWIVLGRLRLRFWPVFCLLAARRVCTLWRLCAMSDVQHLVSPRLAAGRHAAPTIDDNAAGADGLTSNASLASTSKSTALSAHNLKKSYRKGQVEIPVLRGVDLEVRPGEFVAIIGQSGSGKSTLLHLLGTLDAPDSGEVRFEGRRIDNLPARDRDGLRNHSFGMIFQFYHLLPELSALENVLSPLMISQGMWSYWRNRRAHTAEATRLLETVKLGHRLKHKPRELSGGEMQRAAIARSLVSQPQVLLADEPTGNLDHATGRDILQILRNLNQQRNLTIVMVTHDPSIAQQADRIVRLAEGRVQRA